MFFPSASSPKHSTSKILVHEGWFCVWPTALWYPHTQFYRSSFVIRFVFLLRLVLFWMQRYFTLCCHLHSVYWCLFRLYHNLQQSTLRSYAEACGVVAFLGFPDCLQSRQAQRRGNDVGVLPWRKRRKFLTKTADRGYGIRYHPKRVAKSNVSPAVMFPPLPIRADQKPGLLQGHDPGGISLTWILIKPAMQKWDELDLQVKLDLL